MADDSRQFREQTHGLIRETITKIAQVVVQSRITSGREVKTTENYWVILLYFDRCHTQFLLEIHLIITKIKIN